MDLELRTIEQLLKLAKAGDRRSLSRLISEISESDELPQFSTNEIWTLGITGPPGVGKSTLIGQMMKHWASKGERVAVLALDPSSPISGGSFLADRIRMEGFDLGKSSFVRSLPAGKTPGGIPPRIRQMCQALSECGWTRILIETVGTGQSEYRISSLIDRLLLVDGPERGDIIQSEKAGILELADVIAVNKSDLPGASSSAQNIRISLSLSGNDNRDVILVSAIEGEGIGELISAIESRQPRKNSMKLAMRERLISEWDSVLVMNSEIDEIIARLCDGTITMSNAIQTIGKSIDYGGD